MADAFAELATLLERAGVDYAVIGAHAVNAWVEPRATADIDITVCAGAAEHQRLCEVFAAAGYTAARTHGAALASGPDFVRFLAVDRQMVVELQSAKTAFQNEVVKRARATKSGLKLATPEDLIVLKLIADRPKDRIDLERLVRVAPLDWAYIERWATEWDVVDRLRRVRTGGA